jgi:hypothetical protein
MHNVDIPPADEVLDLAAQRDGELVSIYVPTGTMASQAALGRTAFKNAVADVERILKEHGERTPQVHEVVDRLRALIDDDEFWRFPSRSLAVFAGTAEARTYRLPTTVTTEVTVADRFRLGQLLEAVAHPRSAHVLVLSEKHARLIELVNDTAPETVAVEGLPPDPTVLQHVSVGDQRPRQRAGGSTGDNVERQKYARLAHDAILPVIRDSGLPLILATTPNLASAFREISSYEHFVDEVIEGNFDDAADDHLADRARPILDRAHDAELDAWRERFGELSSAGRATADLSDIGRAVAAGAVESLMVDLDADVRGWVSDDDGRVELGGDDSGGYSIPDELASRVLQSRGTVLAVHGRGVPQGASAAAILRYAV